MINTFSVPIHIASPEEMLDYSISFHIKGTVCNEGRTMVVVSLLGWECEGCHGPNSSETSITDEKL